MMRETLRKWMVGALTIIWLLVAVACEQQPAVQSKQNSGRPDFGAIADMEGGDKEDQQKATADAPPATAGAPAATGGSTEATQK